MSVSVDFAVLNMTNTTISTVDYYIQACLLPLIVIFGVVGNISNIYIFTRPSLYRSCSIYFLAGAGNGLLLLLFGTVTRWLGHTFPGLDATRYSLFFCRFRNYLMNVIYDLPPYFIACVTIDRFCSSSHDVRIRRLSSRPKIAYTVIIIIILMTLLAYCHILMNYTIINSICQAIPGFYARFFPFFATVYYFTPVSVIIIFGIGTIHNVQLQRARIRSMTIRTDQMDRRRMRNDNQILFMLIAHIICYTCFAIPYHITLIIAVVTPSISTNLVFIFAQQMAIIALNFGQAIDCYVYTLTAALYRKELKTLLERICRKTRIGPINGIEMGVKRATTTNL